MPAAAAAAAPSMLSNVPNKIERERETVKHVARCQRSAKLNAACNREERERGGGEGDLIYIACMQRNEAASLH